MCSTRRPRRGCRTSTDPQHSQGDVWYRHMWGGTSLLGLLGRSWMVATLRGPTTVQEAPLPGPIAHLRGGTLTLTLTLTLTPIAPPRGGTLTLTLTLTPIATPRGGT